MVIGKLRKDINKKEQTHAYKNHISQKCIDLIKNNNPLEEHLGVKKLYLNKRGNSEL